MRIEKFKLGLLLSIQHLANMQLSNMGAAAVVHSTSLTPLTRVRLVERGSSGIIPNRRYIRKLRNYESDHHLNRPFDSCVHFSLIKGVKLSRRGVGVDDSCDKRWNAYVSKRHTNSKVTRWESSEKYEHLPNKMAVEAGDGVF